MNNDKLQFIRKALMEKMEEIRMSAGNTILRMKNTEGKCADPFDHAAAETNKFVELACRDRERQVILDIRETIMRIDRGSFGICDQCGCVIREKRLLAEPLSRLCTECQERRENNDKCRNRRSVVRGFSCNHA